MSTSEQIIREISRKTSEGTVTLGNTAEYYEVTKIPTGVFTFDLLTGGVPENRFTEFYGNKSSGKTTMALRVMNNFLKKYPDRKVLYVDYEYTWEPIWSGHFIEDLGRVIVLRPDYGEQGVDLTQKFSEADDVGMVVIDSLAMQTPRKIVEKSAEDDTVSLHPKLVVTLLRKLQHELGQRAKRKDKFTALVINQTTANVGGSRFVPDLKPGGRMKEFMWSLDAKFNFVEVQNMDGLPALWKYGIRIDKNKTGLARTSGEYAMLQIPVEGMGEIGTLVENKQIFAYGKRASLIAKEGSKWEVKNESGTVLREFRTQEDVISALTGDFAEEVKSAVYAVTMGRAVWEDSGE